MKTPRGKSFNAKCKFIVTKFCKGAIDLSWPKQIKIAQKLIEDNPDLAFWQGFETKRKIYCLSWFLTKEGEESLLIHSRKRVLDLKAPAEHVILGEKIGEDFKVESKPKTIFDFLKYGKK